MTIKTLAEAKDKAKDRAERAARRNAKREYMMAQTTRFVAATGYEQITVNVGPAYPDDT